MHEDWARSLRDQCTDAGVAYFFKQHSGRKPGMGEDLDGERWEQYPCLARNRLCDCPMPVMCHEGRRRATLMTRLVGENTHDDEVSAATRLPADHVRRFRSNSAGWNRVFEGDCREVMPRMPQGCADAIVTDPPYNVGIDKWDKKLRWDGRFADRHWHLEDQDALRELFEGPSPFADYVGFTYSWACRAYDLLKPGGHLLTFCPARGSPDFGSAWRFLNKIA
jgi:Protein of unknown function (DUF5131)/DNA methylase